jgi:hypothetical protein
MIFLRAVAAGEVASFLSWFGQELVVFRSSFSGAWLAASGAFWHRIAGDGGEHLIDELILLARRPAVSVRLGGSRGQATYLDSAPAKLLS